MAGMSTYMANKVLDHVAGTTPFTAPALYVALFDATSTEAALEGGDLTGELNGGGYTRIPAPTFGAAANSSAASAAQIVFPTATAAWANPVRFALVDAATAGNVLWYGTFPVTKPINVGDAATFYAGDLVMILN